MGRPAHFSSSSSLCVCAMGWMCALMEPRVLAGWGHVRREGKIGRGRRRRRAGYFFGRGGAHQGVETSLETKKFSRLIWQIFSFFLPYNVFLGKRKIPVPKPFQLSMTCHSIHCPPLRSFLSQPSSSLPGASPFVASSLLRSH